jgi:hypothetical protein
MQYIKEGFTLPVPLNLIPTPGGLFHAVKFLIDKLRHGKQLEHANSISFHSTDEPSNIELKSQILQSVHPNINNNNVGLSNGIKSEQQQAADGGGGGGGRRREAVFHTSQHHSHAHNTQVNTDEGLKMTYRVCFGLFFFQFK